MGFSNLNASSHAYPSDEEADNDSNFSDSASFPTNEDIESIIVNAPESVPGDVEIRSVSSIEYGASASHTYSSLRSFGSIGSGKERMDGGGSIGGGGSSVGDMSEKSETKSNFTDERKLSFSENDYEHPVSRVTITHSSHLYSDNMNIATSGPDSGPDDSERGGILELSTYPTAMSVKSDVATVCSGSFTEDIDIASVGTAHSETTHSTTNMSTTPAGRKKHDRGVEFATETSTMWTHSILPTHQLSRNSQAPALFRTSPLQEPISSSFLATSIIMNDMGPPRNSQAPALFRTSPLQEPISSSFLATSIIMNDMGPPLSRSLLERATGSNSIATSLALSVRSFASSNGPPSRPGSVKSLGSIRSFGSQATSEDVHVDTDDCGGSIVDVDELHFADSLDESPAKNQQGAFESVIFSASEVAFATSDVQQEMDERKDELPTNAPLNQNLASLHDRLSVDNGRTSPGGTVYKGRGVRRYQGRYMHLPLTRFQQNLNVPLPVEGALIGQHETHQARDTPSPDHHCDYWKRGRGRSRSSSRSRSRSRSRDRPGTNNNHAGMKRSWSRSRSNSPPSRRSPNRSPPRTHGDRDFRGTNVNGDNNTNGNHRPGNNANGNNRWRNNRAKDSGERRDYPRNNSRRVRGGGRHSRRRSPNSRGMTPRDPRHGDSHQK